MNYNTQNWRDSKRKVSVKDIEVHCREHVWEKMYGWTEACDVECGGEIIIKRQHIRDEKTKLVTKTVFTLIDAFLPEQKANSYYHTITTDGRDKLYRWLAKKGINTNVLRGHWHSHVNMEPDWSYTDDEEDDLRVNDKTDFLVSIVLNKKRRYRCRLNILSPIGLEIDNIVMKFIPGHKLRYNNWEHQVKQAVKPFEVKKVEPTTDFGYMGYTNYHGYQGYNNYDDWIEAQRKKWAREDEEKFFDPKYSYVRYKDRIMTFDDYMKEKYPNTVNRGSEDNGDKRGEIQKPVWPVADGKASTEAVPDCGSGSNRELCGDEPKQDGGEFDRSV